MDSVPVYDSLGLLAQLTEPQNGFMEPKWRACFGDWAALHHYLRICIACKLTNRQAANHHISWFSYYQDLLKLLCLAHIHPWDWYVFTYIYHRNQPFIEVYIPVPRMVWVGSMHPKCSRTPLSPLSQEVRPLGPVVVSVPPSKGFGEPRWWLCFGEGWLYTQ